MTSEKNKISFKQISRFVTVGLGLTWFELIGEVWKLGQQIMRGFSSEGMYEVLEYETTLEIHDKKGNKATVSKRQKVRYLQDNILAYQDQAWGDGEILVDYKCSPGYPVDKYRSGHKTYILISLREIKSKGDVDEFNITWGLRNCLKSNLGFWGTSINHRTKKIKVKVIFPKTRSPQKAWVNLTNRKQSKFLGDNALRKLPDGRSIIVWEKGKPHLFENYVLHWEW